VKPEHRDRGVKKNMNPNRYFASNFCINSLKRKTLYFQPHHKQRFVHV